jgi:NhaP-type Na+/H+ or K+/H+ antiporter
MLAGLTGSADPATLVEVLTRQLSPEAEQVRQFLEAEGLLNDEAAEMLWRMRAKPESATGLYFFLMVAVGLVIVAFPAALSNDREAAEESMEDL